MSSVANIAAAAVASNQAQTQIAVAAKIAKMNADSQASLVALLEAASENLEQVVKAAVPSGVGETVDISA